MKLSMIGVALLSITLGTFATMGPSGAQAQQNVCQANPSPVNASDPSMIVSSPIANASVSSPIHVAGQARVFEATVSIKLFDANGAELVSTTTNAAEGQVLSAFSTDVTFSVSASSGACLWVFEASAQDGSPTNVVQVPLSLLPAGLPSTGSGGASTQTQPGWALTALAMAGLALFAGGWAARRVRR